MTARDDYAVFYMSCLAATWSIKTSPLLVRGGGVVGLWTDVSPFSPPQLLAPKIKQSFLSTNLVYWLLRASSQTHTLLVVKIPVPSVGLGSCASWRLAVLGFPGDTVAVTVYQLAAVASQP